MTLQNREMVKIFEKIWKTFKEKRRHGEFDSSQKDGFITVLQREEMIDKLFEIIKTDMYREFS